MDNPASLFLAFTGKASVKKLVPLSVGHDSWWRSPRALAVWVLSLVIGLQVSTGVFGGLERAFYDLASSHNPHPPSARIAVIAIDDQSLASLGPLPWSRNIHARLIDTLAAAKPKVVVDTVPHLVPQTDRSLVFIQQMKAALAQMRLPADAAQEGVAQISDVVLQPLAVLLAQAESELNGDARLEVSLQQAANVLLAAKTSPGSGPGQQVLLPLARLGAAAAGIGRLQFQPDDDGVLRSEQLLVSVGGQSLPSLALLAAAHGLDIKASELRFSSDQVLRLGSKALAANEVGDVLTQYYPSVKGQPVFAQDSFADVLTGKVSAAKYADKLVIIGVTATDSGRMFAVPGQAAMSSAQVLAHRTSSLLQAQVAHQPQWATGLQWGVTVLVVAGVVWGPPMLSVAVAASLTVALCCALLLAQYGLLRATSLHVPLVFPAVLLLGGLVVQWACRLRQHQPAQSLSTDESAATTDRMMGLALQGQGQLDMAFERFRRVPMHAALAQDMYWLALDFERRQQVDKATAVFQCIVAFDAGFKDVKERLARVGASAINPETVAPGRDKPGESADDTLMLGRYQVVKELGKGAMGEVYLGKDPRIGRSVALKTMALGQEFDGLDLVQARERFFREAKAAGRLQHPSIVTIFDVGEEGELAYIAMEYIKGQDLQQHCKRAALLPVPNVLSIVARVAQALDYAHGMQVLHRDIKPGNVMYDSLTDSVKITDFGIARITDGSKTRTGLVMGTPSYMSPEQLAGMPLDGRSDLYSLGIMMWQLLTGLLPFRAESMAELLSKIASQQAPDIRRARSEISAELAAVVARLLCKSPQDRYQNGEAVAAALMRCVGRAQAGVALPQNSPPLRQPGAPAGSIDLE